MERARTRGFTLVEVMMVTAISAFVFAGVLSAYIFLGRGLVREANSEQMESGTRVAIYNFTRDVSAAQSILAQTSVSPSIVPQITLTIPTSTGTLSTVTYFYDSLNMTLTRSSATGQQQLLGQNQSGLSSLNLSFAFYDLYGNLITSLPASQNIKQAMMTYTATTGTAVSGAQSTYSVSSPLVILKNKPSLQ